MRANDWKAETLAAAAKATASASNDEVILHIRESRSHLLPLLNCGVKNDCLKYSRTASMAGVNATPLRQASPTFMAGT
jgi:hypothetical protein